MEKYQFKLPDIGEGIAEGTIGEWHVKEGDSVAEDGDLVQIENDKSVEELPSPVGGKVTKILVAEGETAEVGQALVELEVENGKGNVAADEASDQKAAPAPAASDSNASTQSDGQETYEFKLPDIGEGIAEGTIGEWHVKEGDTVAEDGDLVQIENDKSVEELPSPVAGTVTKILVAEGETAEVGQALVRLAVAAGQGNVEGAIQPAPAPQQEAAAAAEEKPAANQASAGPQDHSLPVLAMPGVRAYAREKGADLAQITGSGNHGQILKTDIDSFLAGGGAKAQETTAPAEKPAEKEKAAAAPISTSPDWPEHSEKMSGIRYATAKAMERSNDNVPHVHIFDDVVVDAMWDHRKKYKELAASKGVHLTFLAYVTKALAVVVKEFPIFNSQVDMDNKQSIYKDYINIGIATDTDRGLFVPNVKHADQLSLFDIARAISTNTEKAKDGKLSSGDMSHTGISITNIGSVGGGFFTPIINFPEVAILGIGKISPEAVVVDGEVKAARVLKLTMAFDHRVIDGATAQKAVNRLKELLADPELLLMEG
ncbi:pyruvate dehydrogenase complex E2 component dihydrolipoamide acetyltransferase [Ligilactobacillus salitolerans]|uniref:Dihydrolipoamide acetyltransferase component of pyruvate dehydrogenase complex n=1 Tax=Ligilactobacillus salitolerans TaxID=1808352 RepID=A0A401IQ39_9LACO|nr:2-oxo acid dehydrogenase subunit E2 [Ligilactobacillus salitolerans]GBG93646.1 pyruvate dehydrogenase complex E2 component dihydrolipoamide acetyltransferase [Ligilactobacillus salitolerans]